ncbi:hypothetical protein RclHR1_01300014 [Rhizophagus clarus]|uniref:Kinase-like domain-containing protein n=1 Tax=Rhizophagus clarus TaxID=94130 RepID=A0A2Z6QLF6_9GLOM|nr:hypothetical protein RclHR1_01300014 [Rhizophagus clarus]GES95697.1 kinase-like domain-containing protein [Rhizophagus clarus]
MVNSCRSKFYSQTWSRSWKYTWGNILVENNLNSIDTKITDTGLHGPADKQLSSNQIYSAILFVAPEIFDGNTQTKESDIYSFGMIIWILFSVRPYCDRPHNKQLIQEIRSGLRPGVVDGTPPVFSNLMLQCLDANPSNRQTATQIYECLGNWITTFCDNPDTSDLSDQFDAAEEIKFSKLENYNFKPNIVNETQLMLNRPTASRRIFGKLGYGNNS